MNNDNFQDNINNIINQMCNNFIAIRNDNVNHPIENQAQLRRLLEQNTENIFDEYYGSAQKILNEYDEITQLTDSEQSDSEQLESKQQNRVNMFL